MTVDPAKWTSALAGVLGGAAALAVGEFAASLSAPKPGPLIAVSNRVIDYAPKWFVDFGKDVFGLADKTALLIGTVIIALLIAAGLGLASVKRPWIGAVGIAAFGLLGLFAIGTDAQGGWGFGAVVSAIAVLGGIAVLRFMTAAAHAQAQTSVGNFAAEVKVGETLGVTESPTDPAVTRRGFIGWAGIAAGTVGAAVVGANLLRSRASVAEARNSVELVEGASEIDIATIRSNAATGPVGSTPGITPLVVPNDDFYRIDTATLVPQVDPANWSMTIKGMVENEITFTYDELLARATTIKPVTLSCVSNPVGGPLVGNAVWQGVPLSELLDEAKPLPGATQLRSVSVDGWDCGFPTELVYDGREAMVALFMNDEPLPVIHGFPARLVVSGIYGYVSATKWLKEIELTTLEDFDGYWIDKGWSKFGPIKTQSRIDTPRNGERMVPDVATKIAGVAWAPNVGITKVEVQVDEGQWLEAELGESLGKSAWVQWAVPYTPSEGQHLIVVRATDATGVTQTSTPSRVDPDGATGWHAIRVIA